MYKNIAQVVVCLIALDWVCCERTFAVEANLPDPTRPLEYREASTPAASLQLDSILISDVRKIAVINGVALTEQDWLGDKQVIKIESHQVTLMQAGKTIVLPLHRSSIRH